MQLNALKGNNMKDTAYFNADMIDADMIDADEINIRSVNQFYFRSLNMNRHDDYQCNDKNFIFRNGGWHDAHGNELNDNTMINRVKNTDYKNDIVETYDCNGGRIANPWISSWFTRLKDASHMLSRHQMKACNQFHIDSIMLSMIIII